jgi:flagellar basal-body rod modification protein FlgD
MMDSVSGALAATAPIAASPSLKSRDKLDQGDFLRLLTTQLKLQDPTDPVDNKDMLAQMAQFSSLSGITEMNATLRTIATRLDAALAAPAPAPSPASATPQE